MKDKADKMDIKWENGFEIKVTQRENETLVSANREGLLSLAKIMTALAEEKPGSHIHLDESNSLEDGSAGLIIEKSE